MYRLQQALFQALPIQPWNPVKMGHHLYPLHQGPRNMLQPQCITALTSKTLVKLSQAACNLLGSLRLQAIQRIRLPEAVMTQATQLCPLKQLLQHLRGHIAAAAAAGQGKVQQPLSYQSPGSAPRLAVQAYEGMFPVLHLL